jgi:drug/metabolite transporter (DMT)-like permease
VSASAAIFFGAFRSRFRRHTQPLKPWVWTLIGSLSVPLWATWPALSLQMRDTPPLECLTIGFAVGWLVLDRLKSEPHDSATSQSLSVSWIPALAFAIGESGSAVLFLWATHYIGAAEANLIMYLWPAMIVGFGAIAGIFRLQFRHYIGIALGFLGTAILTGVEPLSLSYVGVTLALLAGASWALYCLFRLRWQGDTGPTLTRGFGISAALCGVLHLILEHPVMPSIGTAGAAVLVGIVPTAFANLAWDKGLRRGDSQLLAVAAYGTPLCSALLLSLLGLESLSWKILIGAFLIVTAGLMSRTGA